MFYCQDLFHFNINFNLKKLLFLKNKFKNFHIQINGSESSFVFLKFDKKDVSHFLNIHVLLRAKKVGHQHY
jgi:hypothetical protein